jgi:hypothetical protein
MEYNTSIAGCSGWPTSHDLKHLSASDALIDVLFFFTLFASSLSVQWFWRITDTGVMEGHPVEISRFWYGLPRHLDHVDAVYERGSDGHIVFFSGESSRCLLFKAWHGTMRCALMLSLCVQLGGALL